MKRYELFQGVYIHTPFCLQKCRYCDFPSYAGFSADVRERYVAALCREIACRRNPINATSEIGHLIYAKRFYETLKPLGFEHAIEGAGTEDVMGNFRLEGEKKGQTQLLPPKTLRFILGAAHPQRFHRRRSGASCIA